MTATEIELVLIPAGEFQMGSCLTETELVDRFQDWKVPKTFFKDERPLHRVRISRPFYLGRYEVTVEQFRRFVNDTGYKTEAETDPSGSRGWNQPPGMSERNVKFNWKYPGFIQTEDHPVVNVTRHDAKTFCEWLSRETGMVYRLPTEAEWEYACKAGTTTLWSNGDQPDAVRGIGNCADGATSKNNSNGDTIDEDDVFECTAPVGSFNANQFGLFDMHGNVWEWCEDVYIPDLYVQRTDLTIDPIQTSGSDYRVLRGGSWSCGIPGTRSANRYLRSPGKRDIDIGFRIARLL
jgi:formylglycine-generating enzyme required for sulfatase activity